MGGTSERDEDEGQVTRSEKFRIAYRKRRMKVRDDEGER
jgi:hypothetical protein